MKKQRKDLLAVIDKIGPQFAQKAAEHDENDTFVADNYSVLKEHNLLSACVPEEMGGGGVTHGEICRALRELAHYCDSTALALSMHTHVVLAQLWNHLHGKPGRAVLEKVAASELVLVSTGGRDWLDSNGDMEAVDGGYRVTARKFFASGCPAGNVVVTSARFENPKEGKQVLHFPVPMSAEGVSIVQDWKAMGMRATGSNSVVFDKVFVPEEAVVARRAQGDFNPMWSMIATVALPVFMSPYVGLAEAAAAIAIKEAARRKDDPAVPYLLGEMENSLTVAQMALEGMIANANDCDFEVSIEKANAALVRKTIAAKAVRETVDKALEAAGGSAFFRKVGLERLVRDSYAAQFHPLPEKKQQLFTGRLALGLDPIAGELPENRENVA